MTVSRSSGPVTASLRLALRPGVHVLRRDSTTLQVGLDPARAVVLPDRPEVREVLEALATPGSVVDRQRCHDGTLDLLERSGLLVDLDRLLPLVPDRPVDVAPGRRAAVAALAATAGDETGQLIARRAATCVEILVAGSPEASDVVTTVAALLDAVGLTHAGRREAAPAGRGRVGLLVAVGEPSRELLDPWLRTGTPHLLLRLTEGRAVVGPFVDPGRTACLRCVDAHHTDVDPGWPLLVAQYAAASSRPRVDTLPEPVDPALAALVAGWAVRELVSHVEGRVPGTTSTTVRVDPHVTELETDCWPRHPACGCSWS